MNNELQIGDLCKHFKGQTLLEKNIYRIIAKEVKYTGDKPDTSLENLVIYQNIFQDNQFFGREEADLVAILSQENQAKYHQTYRVQKLTYEEIEVIKDPVFIEEKCIYEKEKRIGSTLNGKR